MSNVDFDDFESGEVHPIDIVESLAEEREWDFDRIGSNQIALIIKGDWSHYSVSFALPYGDESLRIICAFGANLTHDTDKTSIYALMGMINDECWSGAFRIDFEQGLLIYRHSHNLAGGAEVSTAQISSMVRTAVSNTNRFYPAFQLVIKGDKTPEEALKIAIRDAYGRA